MQPAPQESQPALHLQAEPCQLALEDVPQSAVASAARQSVQLHALPDEEAAVKGSASATAGVPR